MFTIEIVFKDGEVLSEDVDNVQFSEDEIIIFDSDRAIKMIEVSHITLYFTNQEEVNTSEALSQIHENQAWKE